jgi:hypothetical protein
LEGNGKDIDEILMTDTKQNDAPKYVKARIRLLDILEEHNGEEMKQDDICKQVADEIGMSPKTVRVKALYSQNGNDGLKDLGLIKVFKDGSGAWYARRTTLPRPQELMCNQQLLDTK